MALRGLKLGRRCSSDGSSVGPECHKPKGHTYWVWSFMILSMCLYLLQSHKELLGPLAREGCCSLGNVQSGQIKRI